MGLTGVQGPQAGAEKLIEILPVFFGVGLLSGFFRWLDGCFRAHRVGLKYFFQILQAPLGGVEKLMEILQVFGVCFFGVLSWS